jgi:hypothetical protein
MRVEIQQAIVQTPNVDRVQINVSNPQIAEAIKHAQNLAEKTEAQQKAEVVVQISKIEPVKDEDRRRKALITEKKEEKEDNKKEREDEKKEKEKEKGEELRHTKESRRIDIKA